MKPHQLHETDLSFFIEMPIVDAKTHLDGKIAYFDRFGLDVEYHTLKDGSMRLYVSEHFRHTVPKLYTIYPSGVGRGQEIVDVTYKVLEGYFRNEKLNEELSQTEPKVS